MNTARSNRIRRAGRRHRGQVLIIALLGIFLLAGMVFYVFNLGDQVNRRVSMQNASDSAAIGGATWMGRSMNVVAMNNVSQTRLITMVAVLDSLPLATQMSYEEVNEWNRGLDGQLQKGLPDPALARGLQSMSDRLHQEQDRMQPLYDALVTSGYDITPLTFWRVDGQSGPAPHGKLWVGTKALEDFNAATVQTAGVLSQATGTRSGQACIVRDPEGSLSSDVASSFVVPVLAEMPAKLGNFIDFRNPIEQGRPAEYVEGTVADSIRRGPYDQLFKWRYPKYSDDKFIKTGTVPGTAGPVIGGGNHGIGGKNVGGSVVGGPQDHDTGYTVHGPQIGWNAYGVYAWAINGNNPSSGLANYAYNNLRDTNFMQMERTLSRAKLDYMWGDATIRKIHHPQWYCVYPEAKAYGDAHRNQVRYTKFYMVQTKSSVPPGAPGYGSAGSSVNNAGNPQDITVRGWQDPATWETDPAKKAKRIGDYVWQIDWTYQTTFDESIGLHRPAAGAQAPLNTVYIRDQYIFGGIDAGTDDDIRNPANWASGDEKPRPYVLDLTKADYRTDGERYYLSFLGVARQNNTAGFWPDKFGSGNPYPNVMGLAEAHVFNNMSWDLWTQDWQARLRPIGDWDYWANQRIDASPADIDTVKQYVNSQDLADVTEVLKRLDPEMVAQLIRH